MHRLNYIRKTCKQEIRKRRVKDRENDERSVSIDES